MKDSEENMEQRILECAEKLFLDKGYNLASTTEIAKEAGCTQALVHYYFRTKENLLQKIFDRKLSLFLAPFAESDNSTLPFAELLESKVRIFFDSVAQNQKMPFMLLSEIMSSTTQRAYIRDKITEICGVMSLEFNRRVEAEVASGNIRPVTGVDIMLDIFSLVMSFFMLLPVLEDLDVVTDENREAFIKERRTHIIETLIHCIKK